MLTGSPVIRTVLKKRWILMRWILMRWILMRPENKNRRLPSDRYNLYDRKNDLKLPLGVAAIIPPIFPRRMLGVHTSDRRFLESAEGESGVSKTARI